MNILCVICARKGSKGIKGKNMIDINGKKLIDLTIDHAKNANTFDNIVISTDSKLIQKHAIKNNISCWFLRPKSLSGDSAPKLDVIRHTLLEAENKLNKKFDFICDLDVTSPLRKIEDIIKAYKIFIKKNYDILFSVTEANKNPYFNIVEKNKGKVNLVKRLNRNIFSRQKAPKVYEMNASMYFWKRKSLLLRKTLFGNNVGIYEMPRDRSIDIDDHLDLKMVKYLLKK